MIEKDLELIVKRYYYLKSIEEFISVKDYLYNLELLREDLIIKTIHYSHIYIDV